MPSPLIPAHGNLVAILREHAQRYPERIAIEFLGDGENITDHATFAALDEQARALAAALQATAAPGDRALLALPTSLDYVVAFFGCLYAGVIAVPAYPPETGQPQAMQRLAGIVADAQPTVVLADAAIAAAWRRHAAEHLPQHAGVPVLAVDEAAATAADWRPHTAQAGDLAFLQYTSGSTAAPKGVMVSHANLIANEHAIAAALGTRSDARYLSWLPLFHDMGLIGGLLHPLVCALPLLLMSPKRFLERPRRWLTAISRFGVTVSGGPDFAYRLCAERIRPETLEGIDLSRWHLAFSGAEPIRPATLDAFRRFAAPFGFSPSALYPCYGLAEATLFVAGGTPGRGALTGNFAADALAAGRAEPADGKPSARQLVSCGQAAAGHQLQIVDPETGAVLPDGRLGEIRVSGPSVAGGYWQNPEATRATFEAGGLRTGDLGFVADGELYISGRCKDLIILRGRNFYPQDLEAVVEASVAGVRAGRVAAFAVDIDDTEGIGIAAEVVRVADEDSAAIIAAIRRAVAEACGEPVSAVALLRPGSLPKTSSGKLQRAACRQGWLAGTLDTVATFQYEAAAGYVAPEGATANKLAALWAELLDCGQVGANDNFFALGGQSLLITRLAARVEAEFGVALPLASYFAADTLAVLAEAIELAPAASPSAQPLRAGAAAIDTPQPLSYAQSRLWFLQSLAPESAFYHVAVALRCSTLPRLPRLQQALDRLVQRHAVLRTHTLDTPEGPMQRVAPSGLFPLEIAELTDSASRSAAVADFVARPFHLGRGPLARALLLTGDAPLLVLAAHHIAVDGWSLNLLLRDLSAAYDADLAPAPAISYADFALWQRQELGPRLPALAAEWSARLAGAPAVTTLPPDFPRPPEQSHAGASLLFEIPEELTARLETLARTQQASLFMALFAGFFATLAEAGGQADLVVGTDIANRQVPGVENIVGFFVNQLPIRCQLPAAPAATGTALIAQLRDTLLWAYPRQDLPFDKLVEALRPPRSLAHAPVFQTKFVFQDAPPDELPLGPGLTLSPVPLPRATAELDLLFDLARRRDGISLRIEYATALYAPATIHRFAERFLARLEALAAAPDQPLFASAATRKPIQRRAARPAAPPPTANPQSVPSLEEQ